jgi:23S rRNA pseudouridine1911/1915/1917 synthase
MSLAVLYVDNHLLAVEKPACLPTVGDSSGDESLLDRARRWVEVEFGKPGRAFLGVVHRLDRPVSGVVVFARTSKAASRLTDQFREREVKKTYLAVCDAAPAESAGVVEQWLEKDSATNRVRVRGAPTGRAKLAVTRWRVLSRSQGRTLVELLPETGRSHQLRVAMASLGSPIAGDVKYGADGVLPDKSIALHAARLALVHPTRREDVVFECAPPDVEWWRVARS